MPFLFRAITLALCCVFYLPQTLIAQQPHPRIKIEFICAEKSPAKGLIEGTVRYTNEKIYLHRRVWANIITNEDMARSSYSNGLGALLPKPVKEIDNSRPNVLSANPVDHHPV